MTDFFWVGGAGTWDNATTTNWSLTSGGAGSAGVPTATDNVRFDGNSGGGTITFANFPTGANIDFTGYTGVFPSGGGQILPNGNVTLGSTATTSGILLRPQTGGTYTASGNSAGGLQTDLLAGTVTFADDWIFTTANSANGNIAHFTGTITATSQNITANLYSKDSSAGTLNLGSGTWTFSAALTHDWVGGLTLNAGTSTVKFTNSTSSVLTLQTTNAIAFNKLWFDRGASTSLITITIPAAGNLTVNELIDTGTAAHGFRQTAGTTINLTTWSVQGNPGALITMDTSSAGTAANLVKISGTVNTNYLSIKDSNASGGALWYAGVNSVDNTGNTGWIFGAAPSVINAYAEAQVVNFVRKFQPVGY